MKKKFLELAPSVAPFHIAFVGIDLESILRKDDLKVYRSQVYTVPIYLSPYRMGMVFQANPLQQINSINMLDVLSVSGYCDIIEERICVYVLARDIAIGGGLVTIVKHSDRPVAISGNQEFQETSGIRWNRFKEYFDRAVQSLQKSNPEVLPYIQPLDINSYILLEVAIGILSCCTNDRAEEFKGKLMMQVALWIRDQALAEYNIKLKELQEEIDKKNYMLSAKQDLLNQYDRIVTEKSSEIKALKHSTDDSTDNFRDILWHMPFGKVMEILNK